MCASSNVACIVLAAGRSTRMGAANKLLADVGGMPMVRRVVQTALASRASPVVVVCGHQATQVGAALAGLDVGFVTNADYLSGLASSLKTGVRGLPGSCDGALVLLGDMPRITAEHLDRLIAAFGARRAGAIVVPTHRGQRGNPVLWPAALFPELLQLDGDAGAKQLVTVHADRVAEVELGSDAIFLDVDTPEALAQLRDA